MIITLIKKQTGKEFIKDMEKTYHSISELEKTFKRTNNMKMYVDLENWKYYAKLRISYRLTHIKRQNIKERQRL